MSEVFETNEIAYRACILYEAVRKTPVKKAYENMKEVKPNVEYWDFEYWYYRFSSGQYDLNHDRSSDLGLSDMPIEVADNIVGNLDLEDKLAARKVCRSMRAVIDNQASKFRRVVLSISDECVIFFDSDSIRYLSQENGTYLLETPRRKISLKGDHSIAAIEEFASVVTHPKWSFEYLHIGFDEEDSHPENVRKSIIFLNSLLSNNKIHVEYLSIIARTLEPLAILLPHFEADELEFESFSPMNDTNLLEVIVKMDQWKKVKKIYPRSLPDEFPIEVLFHAKKCHVYEVKLTEDRLVKIRDILFNTPTFKNWVFYCKKDENREDLSVLVDRVMSAHAVYNPQTKVYRIESSKDYIQISIEGIGGDRHRSVYIEKIRS